jgi:ubiquinol-cytochrome c reductase cytochrome c1 subunit
VFPNVGMPHVLWELQGVRKAKFVEEKDRTANKTTTSLPASSRSSRAR